MVQRIPVFWYNLRSEIYAIYKDTDFYDRAEKYF